MIPKGKTGLVRDQARLRLGDGLDYEQFILSSHSGPIEPEWVSLPFSMFSLGKPKSAKDIFFFN